MSRNSPFGLTPWGTWFAQALEGFDESGRLSRGKSYANSGKVAELGIAESGGAAKTGKRASAQASGAIAVFAKVRGRSRPWYNVRIDFKRLPPGKAERIYGIIEREPLLLARIESGELPGELLDRLKQGQIDLIPRRWREMERSCDCPDWGDPCKHMAAVYYMLAKEIDRDPALLFRLRGLDLGARFGRGARVETERPFGWEFVALDAEDGREENTSPSPPPPPPSIASYTGYLSALLPKNPSFCQEDFSLALVEFYHRSARAAAEEPPPADSRRERSMADAAYRVEVEGMAEPTGFPVGAGKRVRIVVASAGAEERRLDLLEASREFLGFTSDEGGAGYRFLFYAFRAIRAIVAANAFGPAPRVEAGRLSVVWRPLPTASDAQAALEAVAILDPGLYRTGPNGTKVSGRPKNEALLPAMRASGRSLVELLATAYSTEWARSLDFHPSGEKSATRPYSELFFGGGDIDISRPGERGLAAAIESWLAVLSLDFSAWRYRLSVDYADGAAFVEVPEEEEGAEESEEAEIQEGLTILDGALPPVGPCSYTLGVSVLPRAGHSAASCPSTRRRPVALKNAAKAFGTIDVLKPAAALSLWLPELRDLATAKSVTLEESRLATFLGEAAGVLTRLGAEVVLPRALRNELKPRLSLTAKTKVAKSLRSYLDLESLLEYDWKIAVGGESIDAKAFERLVRSGRELVAFREGYVLIDPGEAARLLADARKAAKPTALDILAASLSGDAMFSADAEELFASLMREREFALPAKLLATLRPYQERGFRWACSNLSKGFGCVLADDMGLGKTVQAIAVMLRLEEDGLFGEGALVVAPAALLLNWERELERFAPSLDVTRYHGPKRLLPEGNRVTLTTYQTAVRDLGKLKGRQFSLLVADEAHLLKNAGTRQSRAVKDLSAAGKLALSGTPVENRLEDLRSLFDLVLPGYLGGSADFKRTWRVPIEVDRDAEAVEKLKRITAPFLLRRLKTDKSIISDLPDKVVVAEYAALVPIQAALYESVVRRGLAEAREAAEQGDDEARRALVLKLITSLKEVCDHPRVYDGESPAEARLSGKCVLLLALLDEMLERREKVIVFSQYVEALRLLAGILERELGERTLLYHGGMGQKARNSAVDAFQTESASRIFLVSLKAGGLGLNLTAASRVVHFDLWFNPAVEDQATDRAFRIGQTRNVFVHRIVTTGTFEEKIDAMLKSKRELAGMSVASGETWLSELDDKELGALFER